MHPNKPRAFANPPDRRNSLLLSASPTNMNSPLQNNTNSAQASAPKTPSITIIHHKQPSGTPSLLSGHLDKDTHNNCESPTMSSPLEGYINFKKPQNEIFKNLDGKIQRIVAAHSNLNKLYALNDFSGFGGPKRPFELPPQLPPPPPWVPKVEQSWNDEMGNFVEGLGSSPPPASISPNLSVLNLQRLQKPSMQPSPGKGPSLTIDSAISKLHQRRQQNFAPKSNLNPTPAHMPKPSSSSSSSSSNTTATTITPAQFSLLAQRIKETIEAECANRRTTTNLSQNDKKRFQDNLVTLLKDEIAAVAKNAKFDFKTTPSTPGTPKASDQYPKILTRTSPQTLFNTIRRETSLLLNKQGHASRASLLLPNNKQAGRPIAFDERGAAIRQPVINRLHHNIKVVVPPSERETDARSSDCGSRQVKKDQAPLPKELTYQIIRSKMRLFQDRSQIYFGKDMCLMRRRAPPKSLDKIVNKLAARCSANSPQEPNLRAEQNPRMTLHQQIIHSSNSLVQSSHNVPYQSAPTPIPVFRTVAAATSKSSLLLNNGSKTNLKSKKAKRHCALGLRLTSHTERECPPPTADKITAEQYAKCLGLVHSNDALLQKKRQEQLMHSDPQWRLPLSNRPLRLRRTRDRIAMPASASYKAIRKVGLQ